MPFRLLSLLVAVLFCALPLRAQTADPAAVIKTLRIPEMIAVMQDEGIAYGDDLERWLAARGDLLDREGEYVFGSDWLDRLGLSNRQF
jgi:hypothetical protein